MGKNSTKERVMIVIIVIAVVFVILYLASIRPFIDQNSELTNKIDTARTQISALSAKTMMISESKQQLEELEAQIAVLEGDMPEFPDYAQYLSDFQVETANATDTALTFVDQSSSGSGSYSFVQANVSFSSDYQTMKSVFDQMLKKNVHCYNLRVTAANDYADDSESLLSVTFTADYLSRSGEYEAKNYSFLSGNYGIGNVFAGTVYTDNQSQPDVQPEEPVVEE